MVIIRHKKIQLLEEAAGYAKALVINAMTDQNHPCEILSDLYALSKSRDDFRKDRYLFVGKKGNIGLTWKEVSADAIESDYFVGYAFKKSLLTIQQAVMVWCMQHL